MNCVEVTLPEGNPTKATVMLNGKNVTNDTLKIEIDPTGIFLILIDRPAMVKGGEVATTVLKLDGLKVN